MRFAALTPKFRVSPEGGTEKGKENETITLRYDSFHQVLFASRGRN